MNFFLLLSLMLLHPLTALGESPSEAELRATFIIQFTKYVEWPTPPKRIRIGITDNDPLGEQLKNIVKRRNIENIDIIKVDPKASFSDLNMVVIPTGNGTIQNKMLQELKAKPIFAISYGNANQLKHMQLNFYIEDDHIRFEIHSKTLAESNIKLGAQLMRLAKIIED